MISSDGRRAKAMLKLVGFLSRLFAITICLFSLIVAVLATEDAPHIRFIYLVPKDRQFKPKYQQAVEFAALNIQGWVAQTVGGSTFDLDTPIVTTIFGNHEAAWYAGNADRSIFFFKNAIADLQQLKALRLNDPMFRYVVYVDADFRCGQAGATDNGIAIMSANDLRGLSGEAIVPACGTPIAAERGGRCRWIGGSAHELLHTLGLGHSDQFDECKNAICRQETLMMYGYISYPDARLLDQEMMAIRNSRFVRRQIIPERKQTCLE
jgi:hypothetical protein